MSAPSPKKRIRRRGALLLIIAGLAALGPVTGRHGMEARADDDGGGSGSNSGSGSDGGDGRDGGGDDGGGDDGGGDDGGGDDGGGDDGGGDDGDGDDGGGDDGGDGRDGGNSGSGSDRGSGSQGAKSGQPGNGNASTRDGALAKRLKGRIAPIREIEAIAGKAVPGEIIDVKLYRNKNTYIYRVKIIQRTGSIYDVRIDAVTRKVLSARER